MSELVKKRKTGGGETPVRSLGRINAKDWEYLREAANKEEVTFSSWAIHHLMKAANRVHAKPSKRKRS